MRRVRGGKRPRSHNCVRSLVDRDPNCHITWTDRRDSTPELVFIVTWEWSSETGPPRPPVGIKVLKSEVNAPLSHLGVISPRYSNSLSSFSDVGNCLGCEIGFSSVTPHPTQIMKFDHLSNLAKFDKYVKV